MGRKRGAVTIVLVLVAGACSGGSPADSATTMRPTGATTTTAVEITPTSRPPSPPSSSDTTLPELPTEAHYYVGSSDLAGNPALDGWNAIHTTFIHDDAGGLEVGWHTVFTHPPCEQPAPENAQLLVDALGFEGVPSDFCEVSLRLDDVWRSDPAAATVDRDAHRYESGPMSRTTTAYWLNASGAQQSETRTVDRPDVTMTFQGDGVSLGGEIVFPEGRPGAEVVRTAFPHPYSLELGTQFLEIAAGWVPPPPSVDPLSGAPPSGLTVVWFECVRPEEGSEGDPDLELAIRSNRNCRAETEEAQRIADLLGWTLEVVTFLPGTHTAQSAYPDSLIFDPDVVIARGGLAGQWSDATIAGLQADGVLIVDNRIDDTIGGPIDRTTLPSVEWRDQQGAIPFLETWAAVDGGYEAQMAVFVHVPFNVENVCGGCRKVFVDRSDGANLDDLLDELLAAEPELTHLHLPWDDIHFPTALAARGRTDLQILAGDGAPAGVATPVGNHVWRVFDVAVRSLVTGTPVQVEYLAQPPQLVLGDEPPTVDESFRQAYLDAWRL